MRTQLMDLNRITVDPSLQSRVKINDDVVEEYADVLLEGGKLPPPVVFFDGEMYWLGGGFHRYGAHRLAGKKGMTVEIRNGTARDALWFSVSENGDHGLRRTSDDKRKAVMTLLDDEEWSALSDRKLATQACVSHTFVADTRAEKAGGKRSTKPTPAAKKEKIGVKELRGAADGSTVSQSGMESDSTQESDKNISAGANLGDPPRPGAHAPPPPADQQEDPIIVLAEENDRLVKRLAIAAATGYSEEERSALKTLLDDLHAELASTRAERDSIASQRDSYMRENVELKKQIGGMKRRLDKYAATA